MKNWSFPVLLLARTTSVSLALFEQDLKQTPNFNIHISWEESKGEQQERRQSRKEDLQRKTEEIAFA